MRLHRAWIAGFAVFFLPVAARAASTSTATGPWSEAATWVGGVVPTAGQPVLIQAGHTVTVNTAAAQAGAVTVNGTLRFSTSTTSSLTLVGGDMAVSGTLEMGTAAHPIPADVEAKLVLAYGSTAGQYGLMVGSGGHFLTCGAAKNPYALASAAVLEGGTSVDVPASSTTGWKTGDVILLGKTQRSAFTETEERTIDTIGSSDPAAITWTDGLDYPHHSTRSFVVANLTRNVVIRSSGTSNTAYIRCSVENAADFRLLHTEFAYLGANIDGRYGVTADGQATRLFIASCTFHDGYNGLTLNLAQQSDVRRNIFFHNARNGFYQFGNWDLEYGSNLIEGNLACVNGVTGFNLTASSFNRLLDNLSFDNTEHGMYYVSGRRNRAERNQVFSNNGFGFYSAENSIGNTFQNNTYSLNSSHGFYGGTGCLFWKDTVKENQSGLRSGGNNVFISVNSYGNTAYGLDTLNSGTLFVDGRVGYDASDMAFPNTGHRAGVSVVDWIAAPMSLTLRNTRIHSLNPVDPSTLDGDGTFIRSFNQNSETGTLRMWGGYTISGSTLTLDYDADLYPSTATVPKVMRGTSVSAVAVDSTNDANAVSQLVTFTFTGGVWVASGSVSGLFTATGAPTWNSSTGGTADFAAPPGTTQFRFSLAASGAQEGDMVDFALLAASKDTDTQKKLFFEDSATTFNGGKAKLTVAPGAGLVLRGIAGDETLVSTGSASAPSYTLVSSGSFTAEHAEFDRLDSNGIQLSGFGGVSFSTVTIRSPVLAAGTNAYVTARDLTSNATFYGLAFGAASPLPSQTLYNACVAEDEGGLSWGLWGGGGDYGGPGREYDPTGAVRWLDGVAPDTIDDLSAAAHGEAAARLSFSAPGNDGGSGYFSGSWRVFYSTTQADLTGATTAQAAAYAATGGDPGAAQTLDVPGLLQNTTYYFAVWAADDTPNYSTAAATASAAPSQKAPTASLAAGAERDGYVPRAAVFVVRFSTAMGPSAAGAITARRVRDNAGNVVDQAVNGSVATTDNITYTFTPLETLGGNSVYEVRVATTAQDLYLTASSSATARFTTMMDHTKANAWGSGGIQLAIPAGAMAEDGYVVSAALDAGAAAAATRKLVSNTGDPFRQTVNGTLTTINFHRADGTARGDFVSPVTVTLSYPDADGDGIVDGTSVKVGTLRVHRLDESTESWQKLPTSVVDPTAKTVSAQTTHLSVFAALGAAATELGDAHVFPNPFSSADGHRTVTFAGLGQLTTVRVYTMWGELVKEMNTPDAQGRLVWDVTNKSGQPLAPGLYYYRLVSGGNVKTGKLVVVR